MQILNSSLKQRLHKGQGTAARLLNKLPDRAHEALAQALAYPYQYPDLDPFIKCMMAAQLKQGKVGFIGADLANEYMAGVIILAAAPCTAMVFVWSHLTKGNPAYTVVQVATNDLIILVECEVCDIAISKLEITGSLLECSVCCSDH